MGVWEIRSRAASREAIFAHGTQNSRFPCCVGTRTFHWHPGDRTAGTIACLELASSWRHSARPTVARPVWDQPPSPALLGSFAGEPASQTDGGYATAVCRLSVVGLRSQLPLFGLTTSARGVYPTPQSPAQTEQDEGLRILALLNPCQLRSHLCSPPQPALCDP